MCGIAGIVRWRGGRGVEPAEIQAMVDSLSHRGPDDQGTICEGGVGMGMRRLAIQDLSPAGHQPMTSPDGAVTIVYNGEIYDHLDLRARLLAEGQVFRGTSDTETLLHGYARMGIDSLLKAVNGMFAFAVLDRRKKKLFLVRDGFGVKPLYLRRGPGQLAFASEIRALAHDGLGRPSAHPDFVASYLQIGWVPSPGTAFAGVVKLAPGTAVEVDLDNGDEEFRVFYRLTPEALPPRLSDDDLLSLFRERLNWVVRRQLISDVPIGLFLSGGLDSSALLTMATPHLPVVPSSFSVGFQGSAAADETAAAAIVARTVNSPQTIFSLNSDALGDLAPLLEAMEEPIADSAIVPLWHLCRGTAARVKVALSGEGGDEALGGYTRYFWGYAASLIPSPPILSRTLRSAFDVSLWSQRSEGVGNVTRRLRKFLRTTGLGEVERYVSWFEIFDAAERQRLAGQSLDLVTPHVRKLHAQGVTDGLDVVQRMQVIDISSMLLDNLLVKADKLAMAHGLEVRVPFLDRKLVEFGLALPIRAKIGLRGNKPLLRRLLSDHLPRSITRRGKRGFELPVNKWLRDAGTQGLRDQLSSGALVRNLGFSAAAVRDLLDRHHRGDDHGRQIFALAMLEIWAARNV